MVGDVGLQIHAGRCQINMYRFFKQSLVVGYFTVQDVDIVESDGMVRISGNMLRYFRSYICQS